MTHSSGRRAWLRSATGFVALLPIVLATDELSAQDFGLTPETPSLFESRVVTLGAALPLSGVAAAAGRAYSNAYQLAVDRINAKGGLTIGGRTYRLALRAVDTRSDPQRNLRQHERLITRRKVNLLLSPPSSADVMAGAQVAEKYQVSMVQSGGASARIFSRGNRFVFGTLPPAEDSFASTIAMLTQLAPRARTVGLVSRDNAFDEASSQRTADLLRQAGLEVVLDQQYSERVPNFYNILTLVEARAPDVLLWSGHDDGAVDFVRLAKGRGIAPRLLASFSGSVASAGFRAALGRDADYAFGVTPWLPSERLKDRWFGDGLAFAGEYERKFRAPPDYRAAAAVAAVEAFAVALEKAGTLDPKAVRGALVQVDFESLYGRVRFGENGQIALPQRVVQVQEGRLVEVFTDRLLHQPLYPMPPWDKRS